MLTLLTQFSSFFNGSMAPMGPTLREAPVEPVVLQAPLSCHYWISSLPVTGSHGKSREVGGY